MPLKLGSNVVSKLYFGVSLISSAYLGAAQIFGGVIAAILDISGAKGLIYDEAGGTLVNARTSTATVTDNAGIIHNSAPNDIRRNGARLFQSYFVNTDNPITTKISNIGAGNYILSATGTGSVVISGGPSGTLTLAGNRKQLLFTVASDTVDVTFTVSGSLSNWQLERDYGLGVASEYLPCNIDQSDGLTFAIRTEAGVPFTSNIDATLSGGSSAWLTDDGTVYATEDLIHTFYNPVGAFKWHGDPLDLVLFNCSSSQITGSIPSLSSNINLTDFYCFSNRIIGLIPILSNNINLINFNCSSNLLTGLIPVLSNNINLSVFFCFLNQITGSIPSLSSNINLTDFRCFSNQLTGYTASTISITLVDFRAENNLLTESAVNQILIDFDTAGHSSGTLNVGGAGNAAPTGAGLTAKTSLQGKSWTVTTN